MLSWVICHIVKSNHGLRNIKHGINTNELSSSLDEVI